MFGFVQKLLSLQVNLQIKDHVLQKYNRKIGRVEQAKR